MSLYRSEAAGDAASFRAASLAHFLSATLAALFLAQAASSQGQAKVPGTGAQAAPLAFAVPGLAYVAQTFNNCGPASFAMAASASGLKPDQAAAAAIMRPHEKDSHSALEDFPRAASAFGLSCVVARAVDTEAIKALLRTSVPVIAPTWHWDQKLGGMAHYLVIYGYDDRAGAFRVHDSLLGKGLLIDYATLGVLRMPRLWAAVAIYPPAKEAAVRACLTAPEPELARARRMLEASAASEGPRAYAALGGKADYASLKTVAYACLDALEGRFEKAALSFELAIDSGLPWRYLWYGDLAFRAWLGSGRLDELLRRGAKALEGRELLAETLFWMGLARLAKGEGRGEELRKALELSPHWKVVMAPIIARLDTGRAASAADLAYCADFRLEYGE